MRNIRKIYAETAAPYLRDEHAVLNTISVKILFKYFWKDNLYPKELVKKSLMTLTYY